MTAGAIDALRADREALLEICAGLGGSDWKAESGCASWSVQDLVAHVGTLFWMVVDPSALPDTSALPTERAQDANVESRRSWSPAQVLSDYESVSAKALDALAGLVDQDFEVPLGDLGTYPASVVPTAFSFDHFVHIRADLFAPRGPLMGEPPPSDELRLVPALEWAQAALPQQNRHAVASLSAAVEIELSGPGARAIRLGPGEPASVLHSEAPLFLRWITQRCTWEEAGVVASGDERDLARARTLRVF